MKVIFVVALVIAIFAFAPFATIWALNVLFPVLAIPYSFETWAASLILFGLTRASITKSN